MFRQIQISSSQPSRVAVTRIMSAVMPRFAAAKAVDQAIQTHGGNGLASEYGLVQALASSRLSNIAPVSKEMALNFVAQFSLGLPKSY